MMKVSATYEACSDCVIYVANGDTSGMDEATAERVSSACDALGEYAHVGDTEYGFSNYRCEVCNGLAGDRFEIVVMEPCTPTEALSEAISNLDGMVGDLELDCFDITEHDAQGCVLGLHFAIADVLSYRLAIAEPMAREMRDALDRWQFRQGLSRWEPRLDYAEGEFSDDYSHHEREMLNAIDTDKLITLGDLCEHAQACVVACGRDY
jgi:hypothetical protein